MIGTTIGIILLFVGVLIIVINSQVRYCPKNNNRGTNKINCKACSFAHKEYCKKEDKSINIVTYSVATALIVIGILLIFVIKF